jgi:hypothetical protein
VALEIRRSHDPPLAAIDWAAPLLPGLARVMEAEQGFGLGEADLQAGDADQYREQALDLAEGAGEGPAEGTVRPHPAPPMLELVFEKRQQVPSWHEPRSSDAFSGWSDCGHSTQSLGPA